MPKGVWVRIPPIALRPSGGTADALGLGPSVLGRESSNLSGGISLSDGIGIHAGFKPRCSKELESSSLSLGTSPSPVDRALILRRLDEWFDSIRGYDIFTCYSEDYG